MKKILFYTLMASFCLPLVTQAEDITLPLIQKPEVLEEGVQRTLTAEQIADLLPWAKDSKNFLNDMLDNIQGLSAEDKIDRLIEGIKTVVNESAPKNSELLMRYTLNRALAINEIINRETSKDVVGTADIKIRVLILSVKMAIKYYDIDMQTLTKRTAAPFMTFGLDYFQFLNNINKSIFDASAEYKIQRTSLEWLQWDLYRDLNNAKFAPQIVKINNSLKLLPVSKLSDAQSISYVRQMKKISEQLGTFDGQINQADRVNENEQTIETTQQRDTTSDEPKIESGPMKKGSNMIYTNDDSHYHVRVQELFADGSVDVIYTDNANYKGQKANVRLSTLSFPLPSLQNIVPGKEMILTSDDKHYHVTIKEIFADKYVQFIYTDAAFRGQIGKSYFSNLSTTQTRLGNITPGAEMIYTYDGGHYHVTVKEIYADKKVQIVYTDSASYKGQLAIVYYTYLSLPIP